MGKRNGSVVRAVVVTAVAAVLVNVACDSKGAPATKRPVRVSKDIQPAASDPELAPDGELLAAAQRLFTVGDPLATRLSQVSPEFGARESLGAVLGVVAGDVSWEPPQVSVTKQLVASAIVDVKLRAGAPGGESTGSSAASAPDLAAIAGGVRSVDFMNLVFEKAAEGWQLSPYSACVIADDSIASAVAGDAGCATVPPVPKILSPTAQVVTRDPNGSERIRFHNASGSVWATRCEASCDYSGAEPTRIEMVTSFGTETQSTVVVADVTGSVQIVEDVSGLPAAVVRYSDAVGERSDAALFLDAKSGEVISRLVIAPTEEDVGIVTVDGAQRTVYRIERRFDTTRPASAAEALADLPTTATQVDLVERQIEDAIEVRRWRLGEDLDTNTRGDYDQFEVKIQDSIAVVSYAREVWTLNLDDPNVNGVDAPVLEIEQPAYGLGACVTDGGYVRLVEKPLEGTASAGERKLERYRLPELELEHVAEVSGNQLACGAKTVWVAPEQSGGSPFTLDLVTIDASGSTLRIEGFDTATLAPLDPIVSVSTANTRNGSFTVIGDAPAYVSAAVVRFAGGKEIAPAK